MSPPGRDTSPPLYATHSTSQPSADRRAARWRPSSDPGDVSTTHMPRDRESISSEPPEFGPVAADFASSSA
eukprot:367062-Pyramimonas_sp.AAC.1